MSNKTNDPGLGPNMVKRKLALRAFDRLTEKAWHMTLYAIFFGLGSYTTMWWIAQMQKNVEPCKIVNVCSLRDVDGNCMKYDDVTNPAWSNWKLDRAATGRPEKLR